ALSIVHRSLPRDALPSWSRSPAVPGACCRRPRACTRSRPAGAWRTATGACSAPAGNRACRGGAAPDPFGSGLLRGELPQHVVQDAAVAEVLDFLRRQQQHAHVEAGLAAVGLARDHRGGPAVAVLQAGDVDRLAAVQAQAARVLAVLEL